MEVGKSEMKGKLEIKINLTCYHLNINKLIVTGQAKKKSYVYCNPTDPL